jgi:ABC-type nitrate/sulfonate/bicarbonate transport system substrate-binding protein/outer membrane protein OmpA-like peptidoglycan-associated protein
MNKKIFTAILIIGLVITLGVFVYVGFIRGGGGSKPGNAETYETKPELFAIKSFSGYKMETITIDGEEIPLLRIPVVTWGGFSALIAANGGTQPAKESRFYQNGGFVVEIFQEENPTIHLEEFAAGKIPVMWSTMDMLPLLYHTLRKDKAARPRVFGQFDWSTGGDAIVVRDTVQAHKDIQGKTIVTSANSPSNFFLLWLLAQLDIMPSDVTIRYTDDAIQAMEAFYNDDSIDVCVTWSPFHFELTDPTSKSYVEGSRVLITSQDASQLIADCYLARNDFISQYPEMVEAFSKSMMEGIDLLKTNRQKVLVDVARLFSLPGGANDAGLMLEDVHLPNFPENRAFMDPASMVGAYRLFFLSQEFYKNDGTLPSSANYDAEMVLYSGAIDSLASQGLFSNQKNRLADAFNQRGGFDIADLESQNIVLAKDVQIYFEARQTEFNFNRNTDKIIQNKKHLSQIAEQMEVLGTTMLMLIGHLDTSKVEEFKALGQRDYLQAKAQAKLISKKRAEFIKEILVTRYDCDEERIKTMGMGWDNPVDLDDQSKNRRVEVRFLSFE